MTSEIKQRTVYQIVRTDKPEDGTDIYVGSTSLSLKLRLQLHKTAAKRCNNNKFHTKMAEVGIYNWEIVPLVIHQCDQKEIRTLEWSWVELLKPDLNTYSPLDTDNKWNHNEKKEQKKEHYYKNIKSKRYYCEICDKAWGSNDDLKKHFNSKKHKNKSFEQLIENVHKMIQEGTFSQALKNSKETYL